MRDDLRERPVRIAKVAARQAHRRFHLRRAQVHLDFDGQAAFALIIFVQQIGQRLRIVRGTRKGGAAIGFERVHRHDPG